jgi:DNA-binding NtrC family response regulator
MTGQTHVLLVDDEPAICKALGYALTRAGYRVTTTLTGEGANAVLRDEHVDLLVVDFRIPDMRGDALFELASAIQPHLRTRTIFTTGDISERAQQLIDATRCSLLRKPFDLTDLIEWVRSVHPSSKDQTA